MTRHRLVLVLGVLALATPATASPDARSAVARALPLLQRSAATFVEKRACFSCHHHALSIMTVRMAERHGMAVDRRRLDTVEAKTFGLLRSTSAVDVAVQAATVTDPTPNDSLLLMAAHDAQLPGDLTTAAIARRLLRWQRADGRWMTSDFRPPHSSSEFAATATAAAAIRAYLPAELTGPRDAALTRAARWLETSWPRSTEDAAFRVMGLVWSDAPADVVASAARVLLSLQLPSGGWPQLPAYVADAYSTGEAMYALRISGMSPDAPGWTRGERFLLTSQAADGSWHVRSRMLSPAEVSPPYFSTGFPYRKDEYLSYAGTCWAVMALVSSLPEVPAGTPDKARAATVPTAGPGLSAPPWLRVALFGTARELESALNAGLDPNSRTAGGTTVLMAAAVDADKTRLLLSRGADPTVRSPSRVDALTIAATHLNTSDAVAALLDAGAEAQPAEDLRVRRTPLIAASLTGDLQNVQLLLGRGAAPSGQALSEALTFGHTEIVRALVAAGADVTGVDSTGINLLHWTAITNRPAMVPILVKAGVPLDALDDFGYTPLMYAATVDHGNADMVTALLAAGADPNIRNDEGRTALQQATRLKHLELAAALRH